MINGLYSATSGMFNQMKRTDMIANNIANVDTTGYKSRGITFGQVMSKAVARESALSDKAQVIDFQGGGSYVLRVFNSFEEGPLRETNSELDMAIVGEGFFVIDYPSGPLYTRSGSFRNSEDGYLVNADGYHVLGEDGPIRVPEQDYFNVSQEGYVNQGTPEEQRFRLVQFDNPEYLQRVGQNMFAVPVDSEINEIVPQDARIFQGYLENSNVKAINEMVELIDASRQYEMNQKIIQSLDETLDRAVNDVGRPA